jgi:hypothetical protein
MVISTFAGGVGMPSCVGRSALAVTLASLVLTTSALAQMKVELAATIGHYSPLGSFDPAEAYSVNLPNNPGALAGAALGGELRLWVAPRIGVALSGSSVSSTVGGVTTPNGFAPPISARVSMGAAQVLYRVTGDNSRARVWLGAGVGAVQHGGRAYEPYGNPVNVAEEFSVGSAIHISGGLSADVGVTSMFYNLNVGRAQPAYESQVSERGGQVDMLLRTGLSYSLH